MKLRPRSSRTPRQPWLLGLLLCACLLAQTLGLVHRVQHGAPTSPLVAGTTAATAQGDGATHLHLFAGHALASDCQLYDHLGVAELLASVPVGVVAAVRAPLAVACAGAGIVARKTLAFQARAPPVLR